MLEGLKGDMNINLVRGRPYMWYNVERYRTIKIRVYIKRDWTNQGR